VCLKGVYSASLVFTNGLGELASLINADDRRRVVKAEMPVSLFALLGTA